MGVRPILLGAAACGLVILAAWPAPGWGAAARHSCTTFLLPAGRAGNRFKPLWKKRLADSVKPFTCGK